MAHPLTPLGLRSEGDICGFEWNVSTHNKWININFGTDAHVPHGMNNNAISDLLKFLLTLLSIIRHTLNNLLTFSKSILVMDSRILVKKNKMM